MRQVVAERYALAFFELSIELGILEETFLELGEAAEVCRQNPELMGMLTHPLIPASGKKDLLLRLLPKASLELSNFLKVLIDKGRINLISEIEELFGRRYREASRKLVAEVVSARKLDEEQERILRESLERLYGREVALEEKVDPAVLGGTRVRIGDQVLDDTLAGRLEALRFILIRSDGGKL
ncbi:MAG TPA: ATP synthase F1 subunit delta [Chroococcales cyanobacterium]